MKYLQAVIFLFLLPALPATATTWGKADIEDPFAEGFQCEAHEPASYGSYIYHWPSKYDQVFWPFTDFHSIWFCPESGYTSFMSDFEKLSDDEKIAIDNYLQNNYQDAPDSKSELELLEDIYAIRSIDYTFSNKLLRIFARLYQENGQYLEANEYRRKAFLEISERLNNQLPEEQRLEYIYLAANYARFFGDPELSDEYIEQLLNAIENLQDEELGGYAEYLTELIEDTRLIQPGDILDPQNEPDTDTSPN